MSEIVSIDFYGNSIVAVLKEGVPYVAMKPICENIGLQWEAQLKRIKRNPVLETCMSIMDMQMPGDDQRRELAFLPLDMLNGWLFGVDVNRVKPELKDKLVRYQKECYTVLFKHFFKQPEQPAQVTPVIELTPAERGARIVRADLEVAALFGTPLHIAQTEAVKDALRLTGHDFTPLLLAAPAQSQIREEEQMLEPTDLAVKLGIGARGAAVNSLLERSGWQYRNSDGVWTATSIGQAHCFRHHWSKGGKSGYNYKWNVTEVRRLLEREQALKDELVN
jgi:hypothetical protein